MKILTKHFKTTFFILVAISMILWSASALFLSPAPVEAGEDLDITITGTDSDTTNFGLNGRDFTISWTASGSAPDGFVQMVIYLFTAPSNKTSVNVTVDTTGLMNFFDYGPRNFSLPEYFMNDSSGSPLAAGSYEACLFIQATTNTLNCSAPFTVAAEEEGGEGMTDQAPFIMHMSAFSYITNTQPTLYALIDDDTTTVQNFTDGTGGAAIQIVHDAGIPSAPVATAETATKVVSTVSSDGYSAVWKFLTASSYSTDVRYYLKAVDKNSHARYFTANPSPDIDTDDEAKLYPFTMDAIAAGTNSISGTVIDNSNGAPIANSAFVTISGLAKAGVNTSSGNYSFSNIPDGSYDIGAYKTGYCGNERFETIFDNKTGVDLWLNSGTCQYDGGGDGPGGGGGQPFVVFSGPPEGDWSAPPDQPIRVGFSDPLNEATINDSDATGAADKVYLTTNDGTTKIAGNVKYCSDRTLPGCSALFEGDANVILFTPSASLTANTFYTLVITAGVTSGSGQSISGSRPGGGHELHFTTGGGTYQTQDIQQYYGQQGGYMPPFVQSVAPAPGMPVAPNTNLTVVFNDRMNSSTLTSTYIKLLNSSGTAVPAAITVNSNDGRTVTINPNDLLSIGEYQLQVLGGVANSEGVTARPVGSETQVSFSQHFNVSGSADTTAPTIFPMFSSGSTGVDVNTIFEFGFSETMNSATFTTSNVILQRGTTSIATNIEYELGPNSLYIVPNNVLAPNTTYTITFTTSVTDLAGVPLASQNTLTYTYTTGSADSAPPAVIDARCDNYTCVIWFDEPMQDDALSGSYWTNSVLNKTNWTVARTAPSAGDIPLTNARVTYNSAEYMVSIENITGLAVNDTYSVTATTNIQDLSGNAVYSTGGANVKSGIVENMTSTMGDFGGGGMFSGSMMAGGGMAGAGMGGPGGGGPGGEFKPSDFGNFTADQQMFGGSINAYAFNSMAGQDVNVFQVNIPWSEIASTLPEGSRTPTDNDQLVLTFPSGYTVTNTIPDNYSPYFADFNNFQSGTIGFDTALDADGVSVNSSARQVTVQLSVSGSPASTDFITIDLRGITNPAIARGPDTAGHTLGIKMYRGGVKYADLESTPWYTMEAGSNSITLKLYAGTEGTGLAGATGNVMVFMGGPMGGSDKRYSLTNGVTTGVDGTTIAGDAGYTYSGLPDGCYFIGTDPMSTLNDGNDYFGQSFPEPTCVNSQNQNVTKRITLTAASSQNSAPVIVKIVKPGGFNSIDIDIFAGGPGNFVVKNLSDVTTPNANGYTINLPSSGHWSVGIGPSMGKGSSMNMPDFDAFGAMPPAPADLDVDINRVNKIKTGYNTPFGVSFDDSTDTLTFTLASNDIEIPVWVSDGTNRLSDVEVFAHQQGFGSGAFKRTSNSGDATTGNATLKVSSYGPYEIGAFAWGVGETHKSIDVRNESGTKIYLNGTLLSTAVPLKIQKPAYTISGKVLDSSNNPIPWAPVWGDSGESFVNGMTDSGGSYTLAVAAGSWILRSQLPPDKSNECGSFSKTVTVSAQTGSQSSQNITPTATACYTLSGTVTIDGSPRSGMFVNIEEWNTTTNRPSGGFFRGTTTDSSGNYSVNVPAGTYKVGVFDPEYGEISELTTVAANTTKNINPGTRENITFTFTGGTAAMNGFIEVKNASDMFTRMGKQFTGADVDTVISVKAGTYNYFVDVFGYGQFSGSAATGNTVTISLAADKVTLSGYVYDTQATPVALSNAIVTIDNFAGGIHREAKTNSSGYYSMLVKAGTYTMTVNRKDYVAGQAPQSTTITEDTTYNFGGPSADQLGLTSAAYTISGTVYQSGGIIPMNDGFVFARESVTSKSVIGPIESTDGTYSLPVTNGTWAVTASGPRHDNTAYSGTITISGASDDGNNITLTSNPNKTPASSSSSLDASAGGTIDDTDNSDMKLMAGGGVLSPSGNVSITMEKSYIAPETDNYAPLGDVSYNLTLTNTDTNQTVKDFSGGNGELTLEYNPSDLPAGINESDLTVVYYNPNTGTYERCNAVTLDTANDMATCVTNHATTFAVVYAASLVSSTPPPPRSNPTPSPSGSSSSSSSGGGIPPETPSTPAAPAREIPAEPPAEAETPADAPLSETPAEETPAAVEAKAQPQRAAKPDLSAERTAIGEVIKLVGNLPSTSNDWKTVSYLAYGTPATQTKPTTERVSIAKDYLSVYGAMPETAKEWHNLDKIARGDSPLIRDLAKEAKNLSVFVKYHNRLPVTGADWKFAEFTTYMLRPIARDIPAERIAIGKFRAANSGALPATSSDWAVVRALTYSSGKTEIATVK